MYLNFISKENWVRCCKSSCYWRIPQSQVQSTPPLSKFYDFPSLSTWWNQTLTYHRISIVILITHIWPTQLILLSANGPKIQDKYMRCGKCHDTDRVSYKSADINKYMVPPSLLFSLVAVLIGEWLMDFKNGTVWKRGCVWVTYGCFLFPGVQAKSHLVQWEKAVKFLPDAQPQLCNTHTLSVWIFCILGTTLNYEWIYNEGIFDPYSSLKAGITHAEQE
jgi:hypothetical protein